jgi:formate hydrogenlyase subunit 6/NADH:ubiquinone oxidoreductase subunit I
MLNILRRSLGTGVLTTGYPAVAESAPPAFRGQLMLDPTRCTGDGACARICPSLAIAVEHGDGGWSWQLDDARCVFCALCVEACPSDALQMSNAFELATRTQANLLTRVTFRHNGEAPHA